MDRGTWGATVHGVTNSWAQLSNKIHTHTHVYVLFLIFFYMTAYHRKQYSALRYTVGPCCLPTLYIAVCICQS